MTETLLKACVAGVSGRLGRAIALELIRRPGAALTGGMVGPDSVHLGADLGDIAGSGYLGVESVVALEQAAAGAEVVIDASTPPVTAAIATRLAEAGGPGLVTGVTGLDVEQQAAVEAAARRIPVLQAGNFSLGVAVVERLVEAAARLLDETSFDLEIVETHHRRKADAPSGTALMLGRAAARVRGTDFDNAAIFERPRTGANRPAGAIGFAAMRGGGVVGEHEARFLSAMEEISIRHRACDRAVFARGAVEAAQWIVNRPAGLYSMQDMIGG